MASGNMGDLWFQLGVKDNTSKEIQKIIEKLSKGEDKANDMLRAIQGFGYKKNFKEQAEQASKFVDILNALNRELVKLKKDDSKRDEYASLKKSIDNALNYLNLLQRINVERNKVAELRTLNPNVDTAKLEKADGLLKNINDQLLRLQNDARVGGGNGVNKADILSEYSKALQMTIRDVRQLTSEFKRENPLSAFSGGSAKVEADIARVTEKLAKMRDLMSEGTAKGFNTSMLGGSITELDKVLARLQSAQGNKSLLTDAAQMKNLLSDVAVEMTKASVATQAYGREKGKVIAQEKEAANEYDRQKRQREASKAAQDAELKAMSDYAKRYMELQEAKRKADEKATAETEKNARKMSELYASLGVAIEKAGKSAANGIRLNVDTSRIKNELAAAESLMLRLSTANPSVIGRNGNASLADYTADVKNMKRALDSAATSQKELNNAQIKANNEAAQAEKQRSREIEIAQRRIQSLTYAMEKLQGKVNEGKVLNVDTSNAENKIIALGGQINFLETRLRLLNGADWKKWLGGVGETGNGRSVQEANHIASAQAAANKEAANGIRIEQKRQQEIARSAAKARNDLASAFSKANEEAKKMQSIVGDIKSLFLQGGLVFGAQQFFNSIVQTGGEIVQQHVALRSILGDVQKADELFAQTQQLALQSPFKFGELNRDVKQLAAFGVEANDLYDTAKRLADIASGLGVSFERLGLAYGQVKARSWLDGKELRQFAYAGLPLLQRITELYNQEGKNGRNNYTQADVKKMISGRQVSFEDVQKVLWNMTNEGGQFYNMQLVLSETLLGRWNKLIDAWDIMLGKFAEGKNVIGGTFSFLINRVTDLVLALDKLSPAVLTFGSLFALKKISTAVSSKVGIGSNLTALQAEQQTKLRTFAVEQQQLLIEGKITQEKMRQNISDYQGMLNSKITTRNIVEQAALEGRLNALKLQKAFREKLISPELVKQLRLMGMISEKETELIMKQGARARGSLILNQGMSKVGGFFSGWNLATIGTTVGMALWSGYKSFKDSIKQDADNIAGSARSKLESLVSTLKDVDVKASGAALQEQVDKMTDVLEQSGLYTDTIKEQIDSTNDLGKEYDILKQKIIEAKDANNFSNGEAEMYAKAKKATGAGFIGGSSWFGQWTGIGQDSIDENINDVASSLAALQIKMEKFGDGTKASMEKTADSILGASAAGMSFEEKIAKICSERGANGYWETFVRKVSGGRKDIEEDLHGLEDDLDGFGNNFGEVTTDDIPKYLEEMARQRNMSMDEFSKWCQAHPRKFKTMLDQMLSEANSKVPGLVARLQSVAMAILNIGTAKPKQTGDSKPKTWKNPLKVGTIGRKTFDKLYNAGKLSGGKGGFWQKEMGELIYNLDNGTSSGWESFGEAVRKKYKEYRNENDASKAAGEKQPYLRQQRMLETIASQIGIDLDVGKNKVTGNFGKDGKNGRQEDKELKALQERVESFKKARQAYQARKPYMAWDDAKEEIYKLFPNVKGLNLDDYLGSLAKITPSDAWFQKSEDRKKYLSTINKEKADWSLSEELKPEFERIAADFNAALEEGASQFDLYKTLLEKTGSKDYAMKAFKNGALWDDESLGLAEQFKKEMNGMEVDLDASDATAKHYLVDIKGNQKAYDLWKKIVAIVKGNFTDALKEQAELIEKALSYEEQIANIEGKYAKIIEKANKLGDTRAATIAKQQRQKEIGDVNLKKFKNSEDYLNFYGAIYSLGAKKAQSIAQQIKTNLNRALASGAISAREYGEEVERLQSQLEKLGSVQPSFLNGGLNGMVQSMKNQGSSQMSAGQNKYDFYKKLYDQAEQNGDLSGWLSAQDGMEAGQIMSQGGEQLMQGASEMQGAIGVIDTIIHGINDLVQGLNDTFQDIKETAEALGTDTNSDEWSDYGTFFSSFSSASNSATKGWDSLKEGNMGGVISGVVGSFTGWIKGFAQGHDKKLDNQIKIAEQQQKLLQNISDNVSTVVEQTLGGIYNYTPTDYTTKNLETVKSDYEKRKTLEAQLNGATGNSWKTAFTDNVSSFSDAGMSVLTAGISGLFSNPKKKLEKAINKIVDYSEETYKAVCDALEKQTAYHTELATLQAQKDALQHQRNAEADKKDSDDSKLADYDKQIEDLRLEIENFAQSFLKDIYSIDLKSWASELSDAVVSAWQNGEDAIDAYREKVKDMVKDVTKSIVTQKIMESALSEPLKYLTGILDDKGQLDETDMDSLADMLYKVGDTVVPQITGIFDALKNRGWDFRENGSSSTTNSIKSITEETADLLASYLNSIRLDVSVNREYIKSISDAVKSVPELNVIARSQLTAMNQLVSLAEYRNGVLDDMYSWMRSVTSGTGTKSVKIA